MRHADITDPGDLHEPKPHAATHSTYDVEITGASDPVSLNASQITAGTVPTARLGTGTASVNTFLRGDSTHAVTPAGGGAFPALVTGLYYDSTFSLPLTETTSQARSANILYAVPIFIPGTYTFDRITCAIGTGGAGGTMLRMGIYDLGANGLPDALVLDAGETSAVTTGERAITINQQLTEDWYWLAWISSGAPTTYGFTASDIAILGNSALNTTTKPYALSVAQAYGALPDPFTASPTLGTTGPKIGLRVA